MGMKLAYYRPRADMMLCFGTQEHDQRYLAHVPLSPSVERATTGQLEL